MATISNTPRPGYVWDSADNVWYPIGVGAHQHTNAADTPAVMPYSTYAAAGKNKILNGDFSIWQRGTSFTAAGANFSADRMIYTSGGSPSLTRSTFTPGTAPVTGYEGQYFATFVKGNTTANDMFFTQRMEDVRTFAGQTVTLSYWAKASQTVTNEPLIRQYFGTGGSTDVYTGFTTNTITTSWARHSITFVMPSVSGKTIGASSFTEMYFWRYTGTTAITVDIWGVQLEAGSTVTAFQTATGNPASELAACMRYYTRFATPTGSSGVPVTGFGTAFSTTQAAIYVQLPVKMRLNNPSVLDYATLRLVDSVNATSNITALSVYDSNDLYLNLTATVASGLTQYRAYSIWSQSGGNAGYIGISAEL